MSSILSKLVPVTGAMVLALSSAVPSFAQYNNSDYYNSNNRPYNSTQPYQGQAQHRGYVAYVPAGMTLPVTLSTSISTDAARPGDLIQGTLNQPLHLGNAVIPAGTQVMGVIEDSASGGFFGRSGRLTMKFNRMRTPNGVETPMSARLTGDVGKYDQVGGNSGTLKGETWKNKTGQVALRGALGAGTGAALGTAVGAIAGGRGGLGRGAWSGAAIGGGAGVAQSLLLRKGKQVIIPSGTQLTLQLDAPVQLSAYPSTSGAF